MADQPHSPFSQLPDRIGGLAELAYNLWWSWHPEARALFKQIDQQAWKSSLHNPVRMLRKCPAEFVDRAVRDRAYLRRYDLVMARFRRAMQEKNGWFSAQYPGQKMLNIAYFSAEYGLHHSLPFYAGGLGFLAGDHVKECSDLGIPLVAVGFLYAEGYVHQHIRSDGWQETLYQGFDREMAPITRVQDAHGTPLIVRVPSIDPPISVAVWKVDVGRVPLYLLDTDIPENGSINRTISNRLYIGDAEQRLRQEIVLGIGGRKVLHTLGVNYYAMHLNDGHPAFAILERIRERVERGIPFSQALDQVAGTTVFTIHTPVPAAHDIFPHGLMDKYFSPYYPSLGLDRSAFLTLGEHPCYPGQGFSMDAFAMRASKYHNGVSQRHGDVARGMCHCFWPDQPCEAVPIDAITNGVHLQTWLNPRMEALFNQYFTAVYPNWQQEHDNPAIWEIIDEIPDAELWRLHVWLKMKMINRIREMKRRKWEEHHDDPAQLVTGGVMLNPSVLTIGFARRFSSYKRADLVFTDIERLKRIVNHPWRPVQFIFAGKAHPADDEGKRILQRIYRFAQSPDFGGRIAFVEDYGEQVAQYLVHGVDVWLNNPIPPLEACGTSGMKAGINGVLNCSILDGWWVEGFHRGNGWAFGQEASQGDRTYADAAELYQLLEKEVVPRYYDTDLDGIPHGWVKMMKESIKTIAPRFCARRMLKEYVAKYYPKFLVCAEAENPEGSGPRET